MLKLAVSGVTGLVGSRFKTLLKDRFEIIPLSRTTGVNLLDKESVMDVLTKEKPDIILHLAAKTNVDECEDDKVEDLARIKNLNLVSENSIKFENLNYSDFKDSQSAFAVNTVGTNNLSEVAKSINAKFIYMSTDFVFSGKEEFYTEESIPSPLNWYGQTKFWGEEACRKIYDYLIVRPSYPYGYKTLVKNDFVWSIINLLKTKDEIFLICDYVITPSFIDDIIFGLEHLINIGAVGVYNLCGSDSKTSYEIGRIIAEDMGLDVSKIKKINGDDFYKNRARRPFKTIMKNAKLQNTGFKPKTFSEAFPLLIK